MYLAALLVAHLIERRKARKDDMAAVERILNQWAAIERAKHPRNPRTGRFRKEYARHTIFPT
jgi:hypothetical protein